MTPPRRLRTALLGTVRFSAHALRVLCESGHPPVLVLAGAEGLRERHHDWADLLPIGDEYGIARQPLWTVKGIEPLLLGHRIDLLWVLGWSELLPEAVLRIPTLGCIGSHPSPLPEGRGRHPLIWTVLTRACQFGLTFFWLDAGTDTGDIAAQEVWGLVGDETVGTLYADIEWMAQRMLPSLAEDLEAGKPCRRPQGGQPTVYPKRSPGDEEIGWNAPTDTILRHVRALGHPYCGATLVLPDGRKLKVWEAGPCAS